MEKVCEYIGHTRSTTVPLTDAGLATCKECGELFNEEEDRKRASNLQQNEREKVIERLTDGI